MYSTREKNDDELIWTIHSFVKNYEKMVQSLTVYAFHEQTQCGAQGESEIDHTLSILCETL